MLRVIILIISLIVLIFNILNIDYDHLLDFDKNKVPLINALVCILVIVYHYASKNSN